MIHNELGIIRVNARAGLTIVRDRLAMPRLFAGTSRKALPTSAHLQKQL